MGNKVKAERLTEDENYNPMKRRSCTDIICLLIGIIFFAGWVAIAVIAFQSGDPKQLLYPVNSEGDLCGEGDQSNKKNLLFFDLTRCIGLQAVLGCSTKQICVSKCPRSTSSLMACDLAGSLVPCSDIISQEYREFCVPMTDDEWNEGLKDPKTLLVDTAKCPPYILPSAKVVGRCVPDFGILDGISDAGQNMTGVNGSTIMNQDGQTVTAQTVYDSIKYITELLNLRGISEKVWADMVASWYYILAGQGVAVLVAFVWMFLMKYITGIMVWTSLLLSLGLLATGSVYSWFKYDSLKGQPASEDSVFNVNPLTEGLDSYLALRETWLAFLIICASIFAIILLVIIFLRSRITIAIQLIGESSKAVASIFSSLFFPILPFILQIFVVGCFGVVAAYLASSSSKHYKILPCSPSNETVSCDISTYQNETCSDGSVSSCVFDNYGPRKEILYLQLYNIFAFLWGLCFVSAFGEMVLAGAFASWYWAWDKSKDVPSFAIASSLYRTCRYHLGTLVFGSLIIAIIKMIRLAIQYVENKLKEKNLDNVIVKVLLCMCKCCFWCLEKFMKFINRNAYVITAAYGTNFCQSAKQAFSLILRNMARVAVLDKVTDFILLLGKLVVVGGVSILSFYWFSGGLDDKISFSNVEAPQLNYYFVPIIIIAISSYFIASMFFSVYAMAVDTIFMCFLLDLEQNDGKENPQYYMSKKLMKVLDISNKNKGKGGKESSDKSVKG